MAIGRKDHCGVPVAPALAVGGLEQTLDLRFSQVLARPQVGIRTPLGATVRFLVAGVTSRTWALAKVFILQRRRLFGQWSFIE
jgi:hypothetical protein